MPSLKSLKSSTLKRTDTFAKRLARKAWILRSLLITHAIATAWMPNNYFKFLDSIWGRLIVATLVVIFLCIDVISAALLVAVYVFAIAIYRNRLTTNNVKTNVNALLNTITNPHTGGEIPNTPSDMPSHVADNLYPRGDPGRDRGMPGVEQMYAGPVNQYEGQIGTLPVTREQGMFGSNMGHAKVNQGQQDTTLNNMVEGFGDQCGAQLTPYNEGFNNMGAANHETVVNSGAEYDDGAVKSYMEAQRAQQAGFTTADHLRMAQTNTIAGPGEVAMDHQVVASQANMWNSQGAPSMCQAPGTNNQLCYSGIDEGSFNLAKNAGM